MEQMDGILDGQLIFGGFGISLHRNKVESDVEYWHNSQGSGDTESYPNGLYLVDDKQVQILRSIPIKKYW